MITVTSTVTDADFHCILIFAFTISAFVICVCVCLYLFLSCVPSLRLPGHPGRELPSPVRDPGIPVCSLKLYKDMRTLKVLQVMSKFCVKKQSLQQATSTEYRQNAIKHKACQLSCREVYFW